MVHQLNYQNVKAVDNISFSVAKGEFFGFLGVNGARKSTTINMLCTLQKPTSGEAWVSGYKLGKENEAIKNHIGVVYQTNCLDKRLTVLENLIIWGSLYESDSRKLKKNLGYVIEILNLKDVLKRPFGKLSGGQKRRCEIGRALMHMPDILFLDEPTTGLDPAARKSVWETVTMLQKEMNMTVFLTTHYMEEAAAQKKRFDVVVMDPPRSGSSEQFIKACARVRAGKIVYISCDPRTQLRDLAVFKRLGYEGNTIIPVDLFPHTNHIETCVLLQRRTM